MTTSFNIKACPVCDNTSFNKHLDVPDWLVSKKSFKLNACGACGFVFTADAPSPEEIGPYYNSEEYVEHSDTKKGLIYGIYHYARKLMLNYKLRIIRKLGTGNKILDVGSGSGYFLNHMKKNGYDVTGVEISDKAIQLCSANFGIQAFKPEYMLEGKLDNDYDLITLWHVFEHVYSYNEYFDIFNNSLSKNGKLVIAMPNHDSFDSQFYRTHWAAYDTPRHIWHFTPKTFEQFASKRGFKMIQKYRLPLDPFFNSMVSASYKEKFTFLPFTVLVGFWSYLKSLVNKNKSSSLIYILEKK